jgi:hypothetical protein
MPPRRRRYKDSVTIYATSSNLLSGVAALDGGGDDTIAAIAESQNSGTDNW